LIIKKQTILEQLQDDIAEIERNKQISLKAQKILDMSLIFEEQTRINTNK